MYMLDFRCEMGISHFSFNQFLRLKEQRQTFPAPTLSTKKITFIVLKSEKQTSRATKWIIPSWSTLKRYRKLSSRRRWQVHPISGHRKN
ncbi:uncharacterized protein LOC116186771 isoform X2 [Apis dorsata]|uniref:uncharacterized protein LOC116186771 isoform X2 n=1 Tax=Apis dorsata TaxID=7462 RepID=UPI001293B789|nr:uncharacterized protein LOC116186771 isoform X2 [Apis dorsata]